MKDLTIFCQVKILRNISEKDWLNLTYLQQGLAFFYTQKNNQEGQAFVGSTNRFSWSHLYAKPIKTSLWSIWVEQHAQYTWFLPKTSQERKLYCPNYGQPSLSDASISNFCFLHLVGLSFVLHVETSDF